MVEIAVLDLFGIGRSLADAGVCDANLAHLIDSAFAQIGLRVIENPNVGIGERQTDRPDFLNAVSGVTRHKAGRLGQAIAFDNFDPHGAFKPVEQFLRQGGRPGKRGFHRGHIGINRALHQRGNGRGNGDDERNLPAFAQFPEVFENPVAAIAGRRGKHHMRARRYGRHKDHMAGKDMEHRQRAHDVVVFGVKQGVTDPTIIDNPGIRVLRDLGHARGAAGVKERSDPVAL